MTTPFGSCSVTGVRASPFAPARYAAGGLAGSERVSGERNLVTPASRPQALDAQRLTELVQVALGVGALGGPRLGPAGGECLEAGGGG